MSIEEQQQDVEEDIEQESIESLGLPADRISSFGVDDAPDAIREYDVDGSGRWFCVVPDAVDAHVAMFGALVEADIEGGTVYVLP